MVKRRKSSPKPSTLPFTEADMLAVYATLKEANIPERTVEDRLQLEADLRKRYPGFIGVSLTPEYVIVIENAKTGPGTAYFLVPRLPGPDA